MSNHIFLKKFVKSQIKFLLKEMMMSTDLLSSTISALREIDKYEGVNLHNLVEDLGALDLRQYENLRKELERMMRLQEYLAKATAALEKFLQQEPPANVPLLETNGGKLLLSTLATLVGEGQKINNLQQMLGKVGASITEAQKQELEKSIRQALYQIKRLSDHQQKLLSMRG
jgi:hypothetical protein